jgi:hypothetical protein
MDILFQEFLSYWQDIDRYLMSHYPAIESNHASLSYEPSALRINIGFLPLNQVDCDMLARIPQSDTDMLYMFFPYVSSMLNLCWPLVVSVFESSDVNTSTSVIPSLNRLISLLKLQLNHEQELINIASICVTIYNLSRATQSKTPYFFAKDFLPQLLLSTWNQLQYNENFGFDYDDEDDVCVIEV